MTPSPLLILDSQFDFHKSAKPSIPLRLAPVPKPGWLKRWFCFGGLLAVLLAGGLLAFSHGSSPLSGRFTYDSRYVASGERSVVRSQEGVEVLRLDGAGGGAYYGASLRVTREDGSMIEVVTAAPVARALAFARRATYHDGMTTIQLRQHASDGLAVVDQAGIESVTFKRMP